VGTIVDKLPVRTSKSGKNFSIFKISDLQKYEMGKVKQHLEKTFKKESEELKSAMKAYNSSGYKAFSIFVFGEAATAISKSF
jgi:hypothetical protein